MQREWRGLPDDIRIFTGRAIVEHGGRWGRIHPETGVGARNWSGLPVSSSRLDSTIVDNYTNERGPHVIYIICRFL